MAVNVPVAKEVAFILVTNQKYKRKAPSLLFRSSFFLFINLLHDAQSQSMTDYLQQVAYIFEVSENRNPLHRQVEILLESEEV